MSKTKEEIAADILIAAINAKVIAPSPSNVRIESRVGVLIEAYALILAGLHDPAPEKKAR